MSLEAQELCYGKALKAVFYGAEGTVFFFFSPEMNPEVGLLKVTIRGGYSPLEMEIRKELELEIRRVW